jgi:glycosyltransferase involved in cell wall biosynthesis
MMQGNILHIFPSTDWGGGEQYVFDLAKRQIESGCGMVLISGSSAVIREKIKHLDCHYCVLKHRWHFNAFSIAKVRKIMLRKKITVAHVHQFKDAFIAVFAAACIARNKRPKVVMTRHLIKQGKGSRLYRWLYGKLHRLIFVSALAKNEFLKGVRVPENKMAVIHNSIAPKPTVAQPINYRQRFGLSGDCTLVGFVGRIVQFKGVELLLEVAEKLQERNVAFLLAGSGDMEYENYLKKLIADKNLEHQFFLLGFLDNPNELITQMDIGILPSLCVESFGLSVLEFMQQGIPVIASNTGAQVEFVENEKTGLLVNPTVEDVTVALEKLLNDIKMRKEIGKNAQKFCKEKLNYDLFFDKIMNVYRQ